MKIKLNFFLNFAHPFLTMKIAFQFKFLYFKTTIKYPLVLSFLKPVSEKKIDSPKQEDRVRDRER